MTKIAMLGFVLLGAALVMANYGRDRKEVRGPERAFSEKPIQFAVTCYKQGEQLSGRNRICYYNCLGSTAAITIDNVALCPLTTER